ncbi:ral guanine nucleotide dissociation stimulator-like [Panthera uncia]|uniref:ral guanine nucleotide dissociation stimulator-like n=1 Tax=Panthera uncia TaxID=29064 RepID=UPI0020FFE609|nr:ral guanine nucleotide dissociation stimulator-like [Panthera uncia]
MLKAYVGTHMPGSELQHHTRLLYSTWRNCETNESESLAMVPAPEQDPDVPQELAPTISVVPTGTSQPRLPEATTHSGAQQLEEAVTLPSASPPVEVVVLALIHCQELEEPPAPLVDPQPEQPPAPAGGVMDGLEQPPAAAGQPASAPEQRLMLAAAPKDEFPDPVIALLVIFVVCMEVFTVLMSTRSFVHSHLHPPATTQSDLKGTQGDPCSVPALLPTKGA